LKRWTLAHDFEMKKQRRPTGMLDQLKDFAAVVEHTSLNRAAQSLNMSQPALSRKISALEHELNVPLFERRGKRLVLTRAGEIAYEYAVQFRQMEQRFLHALAEHRPDERISLTIGASLTTLQSTLPDLIRELTTPRLPIEINAVTGKTHEIVKLVLEGKADLGLIASETKHQELVCLPLFTDHLVLVLPKGHRLDRADAVQMQDLQDLPMILFSRGTWYRILMDELFQKYALVPDIRMEIDSFEAIIRLVPTCNMATLLPASYLRPSVIADNGLTVASLPELKQTTRTTSLIYGRSNRLPPAVFTLLEDAVRRWRQHGPHPA
jgi:DNA-binding transcriptional LysR family regulator